MIRKDKSEYIIQTVGYALDILEQFRGTHDECSFASLKSKLKLSPNSLLRLLATLESRHYLERNRETGGYRLGLNTHSLGQTFIKQVDMVKVAKPELARVSAASNETATIAIRIEYFSVCIDVVETTHTVRVAPRIGFRFPVHCTSAGKVHLAHLSRTEQDLYFSTNQLTRYTDRTITDIRRLRAHLSKIMTWGYAVDYEEYEEGVRCVSVPFRNYSGEVVGAISLTGPSVRFSDERIEEELIPLVRRGADAITESLGFSGAAGADTVPATRSVRMVKQAVSDGYPRAKAQRVVSCPM
jgi:DNA-binding IclR family transcriptional regulator